MAPEPQMIAWLVSLSREYLNADLGGQAMARIDLTDTGLPDGSRTLIWCSHVLEHIPDDGKALSEMRRVLAPGGLVVLQVPIGGEHTLEDPCIATAEARLEAYLQEDHVRLYGRDIVERIEAAGFECETLSGADLSPDEQTLYAVTHPVFREVFLCRRPVDA
jgi:SAM-dependent methyltransferase